MSWLRIDLHPDNDSVIGGGAKAPTSGEMSSLVNDFGWPVSHCRDGRSTDLARSLHTAVMPFLVATTCAAALTACAPTVPVRACRESPPQAAQLAVGDAFLRYQRLLRAQDSSGIAQMFVPGGRIEHVGQEPIVGRETIQAFLSSFAQYRVLSHDMNLASSAYTPCHAKQAGTYVQHVRAPDGQESTARGWFLFQWEEQADGLWLLESAQTSSSPIPVGS